MGPCSASVTFSSREECDVDGIVERLARTVAADGERLQRGETPKDFVERMTTMKADIEEQLREAKRLFEEARGSRGSERARKRAPPMSRADAARHQATKR